MGHIPSSMKAQIKCLERKIYDWYIFDLIRNHFTQVYEDNHNFVQFKILYMK